MSGLFSVVVPVFDVASYLPAFLDSLHVQTHPTEDIELIFVDDGSRDSSAQVIEDWIETVGSSARIVRKPNGGLSSARNAGMEVARNRWLTFCDPDDVLVPEYFARVAEVVTANHADELDLVATRLMMLDDGSGEVSDTHPLRGRFEKGTHVVDLERHPTYFHLSAASGFYRRERLVDLGLRFDERVRPNFEDGLLTGLYLAASERPHIAFVHRAVYLYRRRADSSSLVQSSWNRPEKFTDLPRFGYLELLEQVQRRRGTVPLWLQNMVLYDLLWYFKHDEDIHSTLGSVDPAALDAFHEVLPQIMRYIDTATVESFQLTRVSTEIRKALVIGAKGEQTRPDRVRIVRIDPAKRIALVQYFYGGERPQEEYRGRGLVIAPVFSKSRSLTYLGRAMASQRSVWLPANGTIQVTLDGERMRIELGKEPLADYVIGPTKMWRRLARQQPPSYADDDATKRWADSSALPGSPYRRLRRRAGIVRRTLKSKVAAARAHRAKLTDALTSRRRRWSADGRLERRAFGPRGRRYRDAWVFMDRIDLAQDNAEHLCRYVIENHPEINAWFVIDRATPDWRRLEDEGFRLVQYGTPEHTQLMLNCVHLVSSQVDHEIVHPIDKTRFRPCGWRFTFLQHGVTKDDLSRWVNPKPISCFITATNAEFASIAGDGTPYVYSGKEVKLTGFPRHDRLLRLGVESESRPSKRLVLIMPTWRRELLGDPKPNRDGRAVRPDFWDTRFVREWLAVVESDRIKSLADQAGLEIAFLPHPNMVKMLEATSIPDHVERLRYEDIDIQQVMARGALAVTDYSSNAFEMAYLKRPVLYFQFDRAEFFSGQHAYRRGVWSYEDDGFGPVVESVHQLESAFEQLVRADMRPSEPYASRMDLGFAFRDGECCERAFQAIADIRRPLDYAEAYKRV